MFGLDLFGTRKRKEAKLVAEVKARSDERAATAKRIADFDLRNRRYEEARREDIRRYRESSLPNNSSFETAMISNLMTSSESLQSSDSSSSYTPSSYGCGSSSSYDSGSSCSSDSSSSSSSSSCGD